MHQPRKVRKCVLQTQHRLNLKRGWILFNRTSLLPKERLKRRKCCDVSSGVEETKNKQRKYGDQPHRQAREEGNGQKGWNYNFGKNRSRTKRPPAKNGRFWAGAGRAVGRLSLLEIYEEVKIWKIIVFHSRDKRSGARGAKRALPSSCHNPDSWWYKYQKFGIPCSLWVAKLYFPTRTDHTSHQISVECTFSFNSGEAVELSRSLE